MKDTELSAPLPGRQEGLGTPSAVPETTSFTDLRENQRSWLSAVQSALLLPFLGG